MADYQGHEGRRDLCGEREAGVIFQASLTPRGGVAEWTVQALEVTLAAVAKAAVRATAGFEFEQPLARPSFR